MSRTITLKKATRIEGNANIELDIRDGKVESARFLVHDFRGLEKFLSRRQVEFLPSLISRICGLCSVSQQVASLRAIEDALSVRTPAPVQALREVALLGEWVSSHALSYFFLTLPDFTGAARGIFDLMEQEPDVAGKVLAMRRAGQRVTELIGGRAVHPVSMGIGRFTAAPTPEALDEVRQTAAGLTELCLSLMEEVGRPRAPRGQVPFPEGQRVNFLSFDRVSGEGKFRVYDVEGELTHEFGTKEFEDNISEMRAEWSYAKFPFLTRLGFPDGIVLVGPLSRAFRKGGIVDGSETAALPLARKLREGVGRSLEDYDLCRLLEIHWASRRIGEILESGDLSAAADEVEISASGRGIGVVEAPRGTLVHSYLINDGCVERIRLLVATQFNNPFINLVAGEIAGAHLKGDALTPDGELLIGRCIRTFDPCLSCATH